MIENDERPLHRPGMEIALHALLTGLELFCTVDTETEETKRKIVPFRKTFIRGAVASVLGRRRFKIDSVELAEKVYTMIVNCRERDPETALAICSLNQFFKGNPKLALIKEDIKHWSCQFPLCQDYL